MMNRFVLMSGLAIVVAFAFACSGENITGDEGGPDVADDVQDLDIVKSDIDDTASIDSTDLGRDTAIPDTSEDVSDIHGDDVKDLDIVDAAEDVQDVDDPDVCVGPECYPTCPDDGIPCTDEVRNNQGECETVVRDGYCLIAGTCFFNFEPSPDNSCLFCDPTVSQEAFSPHAGLPCDDNDPCTAGDSCDELGQCAAGAGFGCNDDNICTIDTCDSRLGCVNTPRASVCDDGNECTYQDQCNVQTGVCMGTARKCNDGNPCTRDYCDQYEGCVYEPQDIACDDFEGCTVNDHCDAEGNCVGQPKNCDDGHECTDDSCANGVCLNDYHYHGCDDGNACTDNDFCNASHVCSGTPKTSCDDFNSCTDDYCDEALGCVHTPNSAPCEPLSACEINGVCSNGVCVGQVRDCEDGNLCTLDSCDQVTGCKHVPTSGICDDHNACTINENCSTGQCLPPSGPSGVRSCDDMNECTVDNCDVQIGCIQTPQPGECQDPNPCSLTGTGFCQAGECISNLRDCDDNQPCTLDTCDGSGNCIHPPAVGQCDDKNACTQSETCISGECTNGSTVDCDDTNVCTLDECNDAWGCVYTPVAGNCNDVDVCTINDHCAGGECVGTARACEDYNYCTDNGCNSSSGCFFTPNSLPCDDFNVCTFDDICGAGACHGVSVFENPSSKAATFTYGVNGNRGQGVDVDDDQTTCSPKGRCVEGIDNAFSKLEWLFNYEMLKAVTDGSLSLLLEHDGLVTNGAQYNLNLYWGLRIDPVTCDPTTSGCNYGVYRSSLKNGCDPVNTFTNAAINGTRFTAGGAEYTMPMRFVFGSYHVPINLYRAKIKGSVSIQGGVVTGGAGALGGAFKMSELRAAIESIPESEFPPPYVKSIVLAYIDSENFLKPDIDLDGDGVDESVSVGMAYSLVTGNLIEPIDE